MGLALHSGFPLHAVQHRHQHAPGHGEIGAEFRLCHALEQAMGAGVLHRFIVPGALRHIFVVRRAVLQYRHLALGAVGAATGGGRNDRSPRRNAGAHTGFVHLHHRLIAAGPGESQVGVVCGPHLGRELLPKTSDQLHGLRQGDVRCKPVNLVCPRPVQQIPQILGPGGILPGVIAVGAGQIRHGVRQVLPLRHVPSKI